MTNTQQASQAKVEVVPASAEQELVLANLMELYIHDFSELIHVRLGADGRFGYPRLPLYWQEPNRFPFLITVDGELAGFALVCKGSQISSDENVWDMAEFFVTRGHRRGGIGSQAAHKIWRRFPGNWEVRVHHLNKRAFGFWERALEEFLGKPPSYMDFEKDGLNRRCFSFVANAAS